MLVVMYQATPGTNIAITDCRSMDFELGTPQLHIAYRNASDKAATHVTVGFVENGALVFQKEEVGTFSPGVVITRDYFQTSGVIPSDLMHRQLTLTGCDSYANAGAGSVHVINQGPLTVTAYDVALVVDGNIIRTLRELHTLKPQDELTSRFFTKTEGNAKAAICVPIRANYADGTQWVNPLLQG